MHSESQLNELIAGFKKGESEALQSLFDHFFPPLCLFAEKMLKDRLAGEDVVVESFIKLWDRKENFESIMNIKAFLYITTRNSCLNVLKQVQREEQTRKQLAIVSPDREDFALNDIIRSEVLRQIHQEIDNLPEQCRRIFKLSYLEGLKNHEIAGILSISVHTVKNQKARAIQLLKVKLPDRNLMALLLFNLMTTMADNS